MLGLCVSCVLSLRGIVQKILRLLLIGEAFLFEFKEVDPSTATQLHYSQTGEDSETETTETEITEF